MTIEDKVIGHTVQIGAGFNQGIYRHAVELQIKILQDIPSLVMRNPACDNEANQRGLQSNKGSL